METLHEEESPHEATTAAPDVEPPPAVDPVHPRSANWRAWGTVAAIVGAAVGASAIFLVATRGGSTTPRTTPQAAAPAPVARAPVPAGAVNVALSEFKVAPAATTIAPGQTTLNIANDGKVAHELLVFRSDLAPSQYPKENGDINEEGPGIVKVSDGDNLDPGTTQTRTVDLTTPGTYLFVCNLPGHFAAGMYQVVTVK